MYICLKASTASAYVEVDTSVAMLARHNWCPGTQLSMGYRRAVVSGALAHRGLSFFARADELEADIKTVRGGDEAAALRRLEDSLRKLRAAFKEVKGLAEGAERAAAKCQVRRCSMPFCSPCWVVKYCGQRYRLHVRTGCFMNFRVSRWL